jgi:hypothetical protein
VRIKSLLAAVGPKRPAPATLVNLIVPRQADAIALRASRPSSRSIEPYRRVAKLRKIFGDRVFRRIVRRHIAITILPHEKIAQTALPSVCRKTRRRS